MAVHLENGGDTAEEFQFSLRTAKLEMAYEKARCNIDAVLNDERCREFHVRTLLTEHDRDKFRLQSENAISESGEAEKMRSTMEQQWSHAQDNLTELQNTLRSRLREIENLKAEIGSLRAASGDSSKLQAEKSALTREVAAMKPEIARLRSSQQSVVSEKQSLERQVSSLEVELENTKRSLERARVKDAGQSEEEDIRFEQLNLQYLKEKQERERIEREASIDASHRKTLESKISTLEAKLEEATEQSEQARDRSRRQSETRPKSQRVHFAGEETGRPSNPMRFDPEMVIATPGDAKSGNKVQKSLALPGDKSSFSITPFLNRTRNSFDQDTSSEENENHISEHEPQDRGEGKRHEDSARGRGRAAGSRRAPSKTNEQRTSGRASTTNNLSAEPRQSEDDEDGASRLSLAGARARSPIPKKKEAAKKKRTLGSKRDKTLFDEDEEPADGRNRKYAAVQSSDAPGRLAEGLRPFRRLGAGGNLDSGFTFSPLKRNARAM